MDSSHETIDVRQSGRHVFVTLDRPEVLNAQNEAFLRDFLDVTAGLVDWGRLRRRRDPFVVRPLGRRDPRPVSSPENAERTDKPAGRPAAGAYRRKAR